ncbi:hypothetical protein CN926_01150 [Bacillus thuringiensis]|uniref:hypothetical protein n=1 Tax=Bacillus TaxID=1386 RepID=UPI000BEDD3FE|nr:MULTISPECIES: hypothetical protein [Bacillus]PEF28246.1 hypothetical protein CON39_22830 [Bacillus thuringiensis]PET83885.1 hypothetical protein CN529_29335 [Bacillus thuringiensis]PEU89649.1 hypothetical protein CN409_28385 [Bacillus sp. AFS012607]PEY52909.1 hypothetical protein CN359_20300 [Bacillus thuringiensis]PFA39567.1 hypothetical protein CN416_11505 [Bacillus thuringiensis]
MKNLNFKILSKLRIINKKPETVINLSRKEDEVTVDLGQIIITGTPENINTFIIGMTEMPHLNRK